jgi:hypothetical protein
LPFFVRIDKVGRIFGGIILKKINLLIFLLLSMLLTACSKNESIAQPQIDNDHLLFVTSVGNKISLNGTWKAKCVQTNSMDITETFVFADSVFTILIEMYEEGKCGGEPVNVRNVRIEFGVVGTIEANLGDRTVTTNKIEGRFRFDDVGEYEEYKQSIYIEENVSDLTLFHGIFKEDGGTLSADGFPLDLFQIPITKLSVNN